MMKNQEETSKGGLTYKDLLVLALAVILVMGFYLAVCRAQGWMGFPLDDAWIHQTYARSLAVRGEWAFLPCQISAGSTAPLWSALIVPGYLVNGNPPYFWTFLLGGACLWGVGVISELIYKRVARRKEKQRLPWMGIFMIAEWHLVWAAVSGMETLLQAFIVMAVFLMLFIVTDIKAWWLYLLLGGLTGLSIWVRPDGITLLGPAGLFILLTVTGLRRKVINLCCLLGGIALLVLPYMYFNWKLAGAILPNTFFAKQAEYAILTTMPFLVRLGRILGLPLVGVGLILLPGWLYWIWSFCGKIFGRNAEGAGRDQNFVASTIPMAVLSMGIWWIGYYLIYAIRLPVIYQHGRYLMPAMPVYFLIGLTGLYHLYQAIRTKNQKYPLIRFGTIVTIVITMAGFLFLGARAYADDVGVIQTEMVRTALWVEENTPPDSIIAAHDIGALGYFGNRTIVDLAGLISPEVIPFIRDEARLERYLHDKHVDYLVVFPDWYNYLPQNKQLIFQSNGLVSPRLGGENMAVYQLQK